MDSVLRLWIATTAVLLLSAIGCQRNQFAQNPGTAALPQSNVEVQQRFAQLQSEMQVLSQRASRLDADNQDLSARLASSQQQVDVMKDESKLLKQRLTDTARQLHDIQLAKQNADQRVQTLQASTRQRGGATITANNSLQNRLKKVEINNLEVDADGDVIRIRIPSDRLFVQATGQLQQSAPRLLDDVAQVVRQNYSRQIIVIESHMDNTPSSGMVMSNHALTSAQAISVFNQMTRNGGLPTRQLRTMAFGDTGPKFSNAYSNGRSLNRRIELVVYPESFN
jgi:flagellar motor protein MotB